MKLQKDGEVVDLQNEGTIAGFTQNGWKQVVEEPAKKKTVAKKETVKK